MDSYDPVVLKTVAICEYGVRVVSARYIMKCDDDTFVRLESVMAEVKKIPSGKSLYIGNMNYHHKPLRNGKWAVTYEVNLMFDFIMTSYALFLSVIDVAASLHCCSNQFNKSYMVLLCTKQHGLSYSFPQIGTELFI